MKNNQRIYDTPNLTNDLYKYKSIESHRKNLIEIMKRKNKLYKLNEDFLNIKKRSNSNKKRKNCKRKILIIVEEFELNMNNNSIYNRLQTIHLKPSRVN